MPLTTYLAIAIGGAIGSLGRGSLTVALLRLTGPGFPWGTVAINIAGSFVIGAFATLTAGDSRFAEPLDVRAFVMTGICGGFTTFSSFSLQTLDLLREGRVVPACANVAASVALCLAAVAAGHYAAAAWK